MYPSMKYIASWPEIRPILLQGCTQVCFVSYWTSSFEKLCIHLSILTFNIIGFSYQSA